MKERFICIHKLRRVLTLILTFRHIISSHKAEYFTFMKEPFSKIFAAFIALKILFFDIGVSLGDMVTDFLQGFNLIFDFKQKWQPSNSTLCQAVGGDEVPCKWQLELKKTVLGYGVTVLVICWIPGLVAVIHMLAHYRWVLDLDI